MKVYHAAVEEGDFFRVGGQHALAGANGETAG
jgi:hypothetical protein